MNTIDTSQIVDPSTQQPFTGLSLTFLQNANQEAFKGVVRAMIGSYNYSNSGAYGVVMNGCTVAGGGDTLTEGFIFYADELFYFAGMTGLLSPPFTTGANVPVFTYLITNDGTADPVYFSDATVHNVHKIRRLTLTAGVSGSGLFDMSKRLNYSLANRVNTYFVTSGYSTTTGAAEPVTGLTYTTPAFANRKWKLKFIGTVEWTNIASTGATVTIRNVTGATDLATTIVYSNTNGGNNLTMRTSVMIEVPQLTLGPSVNVIVSVTRTLATDVTIYGAFYVEETLIP